MMYKTSSPEHKASIGVLADLIRKHGATSPEVEAYISRFQSDQVFMRKAAPLLGIGVRIDAMKRMDIPESDDKK